MGSMKDLCIGGLIGMKSLIMGYIMYNMGDGVEVWVRLKNSLLFILGIMLMIFWFGLVWSLGLDYLFVVFFG